MEGNRVCLVYNLIQRTGQTLEASNYTQEILAAAELLETTLTEAGALAKLVWLLEHQYSPDGLSFSEVLKRS